MHIVIFVKIYGEICSSHSLSFFFSFSSIIHCNIMLQYKENFFFNPATSLTSSLVEQIQRLQNIIDKYRAKIQYHFLHRPIGIICCPCTIRCNVFKIRVGRYICMTVRVYSASCTLPEAKIGGECEYI